MSKSHIVKLIEAVIINMPDTSDQPEYAVYEKAKAFDAVADIISRQPFYEFLEERQSLHKVSGDDK